MGSFIVGLEGAADIEVTAVGKPPPDFSAAALGQLEIDGSDAVMVGDDIGSDVIGAQHTGLTGVLVRTGKFRKSDLNDDAGDPDHVIGGIADLPAPPRRLGGCGAGKRRSSQVSWMRRSG